MNVFAKLKLDEARRAAEGKWLIIDFTASWCGPCKMMDQNTWSDAKVGAWLAANAVALQLDVDVEPAAKQFDVRAMPTVVALKADKEFDRVIGYRGPAQLLEWLDGLQHGKTDLDRARVAATADSPDALMKRFTLAQQLVMRGAADEAFTHIEWMWRNGLAIDPAWVGVRHSFLIGLMKQARKASAAVPALIEALRSETTEGSEDWISLNEALEDDTRTFAWLDALKAKGERPGRNPSLRAALHRHGRMRDIGELVEDPLADLAQLFRIIEEMEGSPEQISPAKMRNQMRAQLLQMIRKQAGELVRVLVLAERHADAAAVKADALQRDPSKEMRDALG